VIDQMNDREKWKKNKVSALYQFEELASRL
jgi:hypothetical protein